MTTATTTTTTTANENKENTLLYDEDENVLCYHGPLIYEAKVLERKWMEEGPDFVGPHYFVHYKGWKKTWDEWVPESRVLHLNNENIKIQERLLSLYHVKKKAIGVETTLGKRRRGGEDDEPKRTEKESDYLALPEIKLDIPNSLKSQLVDDWENITKNQQLVTLPRDTNIKHVLALYKKFKKENKGNKELKEELREEVLHGLYNYFNKTLGTLLLYRFERHQYANIRRQYPDKELVELYGAEHLLRLFVQIPSLIAHTNMDSEAVHTLVSYLTDILGFMQKNQKHLFPNNYENAPPGYANMTNNC
ncbi:MRG-domain-containing protein [Backusella circina FSU 941]|nr:MRG-domain-containing protein [Backusella circina FSU 941]